MLALLLVFETVLAVGIVISVGHSRFQRWRRAVKNYRLHHLSILGHYETKQDGILDCRKADTGDRHLRRCERPAVATRIP